MTDEAISNKLDMVIALLATADAKDTKEKAFRMHSLGVSQAEICRILGLDKSLVSRAVAKKPKKQSEA